MDHYSMVKFKKILSRNDTGETGGHQSGILIPKQSDLLNYFPKLDESVKNPRKKITFYDDLNQSWTFNYIYYNNQLFGGTRNEYRLTCMTGYIRQYGLQEGDTLIFSKANNMYKIDYSKNNIVKDNNDEVIILNNRWRMIKIKY